MQVDQKGDFALIGNTLAHDCNAPPGVITVGNVGACGANTADTAPDVYWRSDSPATGQAEANTGIQPLQARSTAVLTLPATAEVTNAYLYWAASRQGGAADLDVTLDGPGGFSGTVNGALSGESPIGVLTHYQVVADVTSLVQTLGSGAYRVGGVDAISLVGLNQSFAFSGWWLVVFYKDAAQPARNLGLFDGLDFVFDGAPQTSTISGFVVPNAGFSARLGVIAYDGDNQATGDAIQWDGTTLSDALNPPENFFNGTRSFLGAGMSVAGDLPRLTGGPGSMSGIDLDVVQVPSMLLSPGQTSATIDAISSVDTYLLGGLVTSISTLLPDLSTSTKSVVDLNGGGIVPGDTLEYTIVVTNTGGNVAAGVVMNDTIPTGTTYLPGSIQITQGPNTGAKTDAIGDDHGEFGAETVTMRLGMGANASQGGTLAVGASTTVKFRVTVNAGADGTISNQAVITASSPAGGAPQDYPTDGNGMAPGVPPTTVIVDQCVDDTQCAAPTPYCDTASDPNLCVQCLMDSQCPGQVPTCDPATGSCVPAGPEMCDGIDNNCDGTIDEGCDTDGDGIPDGLYDGTELGLGCNNPDTDTSAGHCIPDADGGATTTDPLDADTDNGGVPDGNEDSNRSGQIDPGETDPNNGLDDVAPPDGDSDGLSDDVEIAIGTNPTDADSDDDGVPDGQEVNHADDTDGDGLINALDPDSDNDGLYDGVELGLDCSNPDTDVTLGHCIPDADGGATTTSPVDADTDDGGVSDGNEDTNLNGQIDAGETDPNDPSDDVPPADSDGDGLSDALELAIGTDPNDADSDDDGVIDGQEANFNDDTDSDGLINALDPDSDNDGLFDGTELGLGCGNPATDPASMNCTPDADGGATTTNPLDPDTDGGGAPDGGEDANHNGAIDGGETDPNDSTDDPGASGSTSASSGSGAGGAAGGSGPGGNGSGGDANLHRSDPGTTSFYACAATPGSAQGHAPTLMLVSAIASLLVRRRRRSNNARP